MLCGSLSEKFGVFVMGLARHGGRCGQGGGVQPGLTVMALNPTIGSQSAANKAPPAI
jgi:hypothetical protein